MLRFILSHAVFCDYDRAPPADFFCARYPCMTLQGYLAHKKTHSSEVLLQDRDQSTMPDDEEAVRGYLNYKKAPPP